jgi:hypothetical protein
MAIQQAIANSFKKQLLEADHNFASAGGDTFKIALYNSSATLNSATTVYCKYKRSFKHRSICNWWWSTC